MLIFTIIVAATLLFASAGLMSVTEPSCGRRRKVRAPSPRPRHVLTPRTVVGGTRDGRLIRPRSWRAATLGQVYGSA